MRYIEFNDGIVLIAPCRHFGHREMLNIVGKDDRTIRSAGFLGARYYASEKWIPYGDSIGLNAKSRQDFIVPDALFVGTFGKFKGLIFSNSKESIMHTQDVCDAVWGMTEASTWGDILPVYSPLHPREIITSEDVLTR